MIYNIVNKLIDGNRTISVMESCTGGGFSNALTNINDSSKVFKFSAVTYSNEYKIKMGVKEDTIKKYSVYSIEVANEMSYNISKFSNSDYGIGITGKLNRTDSSNLFGNNNIVFISIYDRKNNIYYTDNVYVNKKLKSENKKIVINKVFKILDSII